MGNIGASRQRFEVLPIPSFGIADADHWTVPARMTVPAPEPMPVPQPGPTPEPMPMPMPEPMPTPEPMPGPAGELVTVSTGDADSAPRWLVRATRALR